jgi:hypothetical protein
MHLDQGSVFPNCAFLATVLFCFVLKHLLSKLYRGKNSSETSCTAHRYSSQADSFDTRMNLFSYERR